MRLVLFVETIVCKYEYKTGNHTPDDLKSKGGGLELGLQDFTHHNDYINISQHHNIFFKKTFEDLYLYFIPFCLSYYSHHAQRHMIHTIVTWWYLKIPI